MRWIAWTLVAAACVGIGAGVFARAVSEPPAGRRVTSARPSSPGALDDAFPDPSPPATGDASALAMTIVRPDPAEGGASAAGSALRSEAKSDSQLEEELRWTERALAASRRGSEQSAAGQQPPSSSGSREALATAFSGASSAALGCDGAGHACLSSAECCPGLACAGGVAGYGTVGRCEVPR